MSKYIVKKGDTLSAIAKKYGTTVAKLAKANAIPNPDIIHTGQLLTIPEDSNEEFGKLAKAVIKDIEGLPSFQRFMKVL